MYLAVKIVCVKCIRLRFRTMLDLYLMTLNVYFFCILNNDNNKVLLLRNLNFKNNVQKVCFLAKLPMGKYFDHLFE